MSRQAKPRHVISAQQFKADFLAELFERAAWMSQQLQERNLAGLEEILHRRRMFSLFYEPSTRTRFSFETAADALGMRVRASENAGEFSSRSKGESDLDAFRVMASYQPDVIVVRHDATDALPAIADALSDAGYTVPIINAGDGRGQHPTQALLDLYTIQSEIGRLDNIHIVMVGDLKNGRTVRSLAYLLGKYPGNRITFVAPPELQMGNDILGYLDRHEIKYATAADLESVLGQADVVYVTRIQVERLSGELDELQEVYNRVAGRFRVTPAELALMSENARVMHPLPRVQEGTMQRVKRGDESASVKLVNELSPECDSDPRAAYFRQAGNGLPVRMALLQWVVTGRL